MTSFSKKDLQVEKEKIKIEFPLIFKQHILLVKDLLQVRVKGIFLSDRHFVTYVLWNWNQPKAPRTL